MSDPHPTAVPVIEVEDSQLYGYAGVIASACLPAAVVPKTVEYLTGTQMVGTEEASGSFAPTA